jgi:hypothetical protein
MHPDGGVVGQASREAPGSLGRRFGHAPIGIVGDDARQPNDGRRVDALTFQPRDQVGNTQVRTEGPRARKLPAIWQFPPAAATVNRLARAVIRHPPGRWSNEGHVKASRRLFAMPFAFLRRESLTQEERSSEADGRGEDRDGTVTTHQMPVMQCVQ